MSVYCDPAQLVKQNRSISEKHKTSSEIHLRVSAVDDGLRGLFRDVSLLDGNMNVTKIQTLDICLRTRCGWNKSGFCDYNLDGLEQCCYYSCYYQHYCLRVFHQPANEIARSVVTCTRSLSVYKHTHAQSYCFLWTLVIEYYIDHFVYIILSYSVTSKQKLRRNP